MPALGVPYERVSVGTSDSLELAAYYVPSQNRAAVVLYPGATRPEQARMLSVTDTACCSSTRPGRARARATQCAGPVTATCGPGSTTSAAAPTWIPTVSGHSAAISASVCHPCASESEIRPRPHQAYALNVAGLRGGGARDHASHRFVKTGPDCHIAHADRSPTNRRKQRSLSGAA